MSQSKADTLLDTILAAVTEALFKDRNFDTTLREVIEDSVNEYMSNDSEFTYALEGAIENALESELDSKVETEVEAALDRMDFNDKVELLSQSTRALSALNEKVEEISDTLDAYDLEDIYNKLERLVEAINSAGEELSCA